MESREWIACMFFVLVAIIVGVLTMGYTYSQFYAYGYCEQLVTPPGSIAQKVIVHCESVGKVAESSQTVSQTTAMRVAQ